MLKLLLLALIGKKVLSPRLLFNTIKSYLILYMMILPVFLDAQEFDWAISRPSDYTLNPIMQNILVATDGQGSVFWAGMETYIENYGSLSYGDLFFEKYSEDGELLYTTGAEGSAAVLEMECAPDGMVVMILHIRSSLEFDSGDVLPYTGSNGQKYLLEISAMGEVAWYVEIPGDMSFTHSALAIDEAGEIYVGTGNFNSSEVMVYDPETGLSTLIVQTGVSVISSIDVDWDGNIYVAGSCAGFEADFNGVQTEPLSSYNSYLVKYDPEAVFQWVKFVEDVTCSRPIVVCNDPDYIYLAGDLFMSSLFDQLQAHGPSWVFDFFVTRLDVDGDFLWLVEVPQQTTITGDGALQKVNFCRIDDDNNVYVAGFIRGEIDWGNDLITSSTNIGYDLLAMKIDPDGAIEYAKSGGGELYDQAFSSAANPEGDFYIAGFGGGELSFGDVVTDQEGMHPFLVKIKNNNIVSGTDASQGSSRATILPNPVRDRFSVSKEMRAEDVVSIEILNPMGVCCMQVKYPERLDFNMINLPAGLYMARFQMQDASVISLKIVKE